MTNFSRLFYAVIFLGSLHSVAMDQPKPQLKHVLKFGVELERHHNKTCHWCRTPYAMAKVSFRGCPGEDEKGKPCKFSFCGRGACSGAPFFYTKRDVCPKCTNECCCSFTECKANETDAKHIHCSVHKRTVIRHSVVGKDWKGNWKKAKNKYPSKDDKNNVQTKREHVDSNESKDARPRKLARVDVKTESAANKNSMVLRPRRKAAVSVKTEPVHAQLSRDQELELLALGLGYDDIYPSMQIDSEEFAELESEIIHALANMHGDNCPHNVTYDMDIDQ